MVQWKSLKEIIECGDFYEISDDGQVRNIYTGTVLKGGIDNHGYRSVRLMKHKKGKTIRVHRLVALTFVPNPDNKPIVNHIDGNQLNNAAYNLEWTTNQENLQHAFDNGIAKAKVGEENNNSKLTTEQVVKIKKLLIEGKPAKKIATMFDMNYQAVRCIHTGKTWSHVQVEGFIPAKKVDVKPALKPETVLEIRKLYATGKYKQSELCKMFGLSARNMDKLIKYQTYKNLIIE